MTYPIHPRLDQALMLSDGLVAVARILIKAVRSQMPPPAKTRRGATLRPGPRTPMWNALVLAVRPHLRRRGAKSKLARLLGVPPQRVHEYFVSCRVAPDAERTLLLFTWLAQGWDGARTGGPTSR